MTRRAQTSSASDVLIVGDGVIALAIADALAERGVSSHVIGERLPGAASSAAAGLLAPSGGDLAPTVRDFMIAARDRYPAFVTRLQHETGRTIHLNRLGLLEVALRDDEMAELAASRPSLSAVLTDAELASLEPSLSHASGALLHPDDGFVDNNALLAALDEHLARSAFVRRTFALIRAIQLGTTVCAITSSGERIEADEIIVAAGAWTPSLEGLPRILPVTPLRGQMLAVANDSLRHAVMGGEAHGYLVPRPGRLLVGATIEPGSFDSEPTATAMHELRQVLRHLCPAAGDAAELSRWAGVRPATPDMLPIIDRDPSDPRLVYACGHSKNGILLAPMTGDCVAALIVGDLPPFDLTPYAATRFQKLNIHNL